MEIDDEVVQRALAAMRGYAVHEHTIRRVAREMHDDDASTRMMVAEAIANDASLFRAVTLRHAELQREAARVAPPICEVANNIDLLGEG